jgi:hypothetical protein
MLWFFIGFIFGVYVSQESPAFPNVKNMGVRLKDFIVDIAIYEKKCFGTETNRTRSKSE